MLMFISGAYKNAVTSLLKFSGKRDHTSCMAKAPFKRADQYIIFLIQDSGRYLGFDSQSFNHSGNTFQLRQGNLFQLSAFRRIPRNGINHHFRRFNHFYCFKPGFNFLGSSIIDDSSPCMIPGGKGSELSADR